MILTSNSTEYNDEKIEAAKKEIQNKHFVKNLREYKTKFINLANKMSEEIVAAPKQKLRTNNIRTYIDYENAEAIVKCVNKLLHIIYRIETQEQFDKFQNNLAIALNNLLTETKYGNKYVTIANERKQKVIIGNLVNWNRLHGILIDNGVKREDIKTIYNTEVELRNTLPYTSMQSTQNANKYTNRQPPDYNKIQMSPIDIEPGSFNY